MIRGMDLFEWIAAVPGRIVGINGPQGAGKTTLVRELVARASAKGRHWVGISIDDFYLTRAEQVALAGRFPDDPLAQVRGAPGTHDIALGVAVLDALGREAVEVPVYDKAAHGGKGDRAAVGPKIGGDVEKVLFEGWMLGFPSVGAKGRLARVDALLPAYEPWVRRLAGMLQLRVEDPAVVVRWRVEAEARMRAEGRGGMSDTEAEAYVRRFLPFYEVYPEALAARPPVPDWHRVMWVGEDRRPR
jgi:D-glycerate 3-kinase